MDDYAMEIQRLRERFKEEALKAREKFLQQGTQKNHEHRVRSSTKKTTREEINSNNRPRLEPEISGQTSQPLDRLSPPVKAWDAPTITPSTLNKSSHPNDASMASKSPRTEKYITPTKNKGSSNANHRSAKKLTSRPHSSSAAGESAGESAGEFERESERESGVEETPHTKDSSKERLYSSSFRTLNKSSRPNNASTRMTPKSSRPEKYTTPTKKNRGSSNAGHRSVKQSASRPYPSSAAEESEVESEVEETPHTKNSSTERLDSSSFRRNLNIRMGVVGNEREKRERRRFVLDQCIRRDMNLRKNFNAYHYDERMFPAIRGITKAAPAAWNWDRSVVKDIIRTLCFDRVRTMNRHAKEKVKEQGGIVRDGRARENQKRGHETESDKDTAPPKRQLANSRKFKSTKWVQDSSAEDDLYAPPPKTTLKGKIPTINPADNVPGSSTIADVAPPYPDPYKVKIGKRMIILSQSLNYSEFEKVIGQWLTVGINDIRLYKPAAGTGRDREWKPLGHDVEYKKMIERYSSGGIKMIVRSEVDHFNEDLESLPDSDFNDVLSTSLINLDMLIGGQNATRSPAKGLLEVSSMGKPRSTASTPQRKQNTEYKPNSHGSSSGKGKALPNPESLRNIEDDDENLKLTLCTPPNISGSKYKAANIYNERASQPTSRINDVLKSGTDFVSDTEFEEFTSPKNRSRPNTTTPSTQRTHQSLKKHTNDQRKTPTSTKHSHIEAYRSKTTPKTSVGGITPTRTLFSGSRMKAFDPTFGSLGQDPSDAVDWTSGGEKQLLPNEYLDHPKSVGGITPTRTLFSGSRMEAFDPTFGSLGQDPSDTVDWTSGGEKQLFLNEYLGCPKSVGGITPTRTLFTGSRMEAIDPTRSDAVDQTSEGGKQLFLNEYPDPEDIGSAGSMVQVPMDQSVRTSDGDLTRVSAPKSRSRGGQMSKVSNAPIRRPSLRACKTAAKTKIAKTYKGESSKMGGRGRGKKQLKEEWAEFEKSNTPAYVNHKT